MPTDTFSISSAANDGTGYREDSSWATISTGAYSDFSDDSGNLLNVAKANFGTVYAEVAYLRFDTSTIDDAATITGATLKIYIDNINNADSASLVADYYDFGGEPSVAADWVLTASPSILAATTLASLTDNTVNNITISDLTGISKTGFTGIRLTLSGITPTGDNNIRFAAQEHATFQEPRLDVTYSSGGGVNPFASASIRMMNYICCR